MQAGNFSKLSEQEEEILSRLKEWLYSGGAHYDSLQVTNFSERYRGIISTKPIKKNQTIVFVPKTHLITLEMAKEDPICKELIDKKVQIMSPKHTFLSIFLLQQLVKQEKSQWRLYIGLLPKNLSSFPINYNNDELIELIGSPFLIQIHEKVYDLKRDYDKICASCQSFRKYKFRDFCWARTIVGSRIFGLFINGVKTDILAPFADMLNHRLPKQTSWNYIDQKQGFVIQSLEDIPAGVQVFDSYGKKCNSRYLLNYGFITQNNTENQVCLKATIDGDLRAKKLQMLKKNEGLTKILKISSTLNDINFYESMGFLRFKVITDVSHLTILQKISGIKITNEPYISTKTPSINMEIQSRVWQVLAELCQNSLREYPTTLERDQQLLNTSELSQNMKNILILRSGEKIVLKLLIGYSHEIRSILKQGFQKSCQYLTSNQQQPWSKYLAKVLSIMPGEKSKILTESLMPEVQEEEAEDNQEELINN